MSPEKKTDYDKGSAAHPEALPNVFQTGTVSTSGSLIAAQEVVQLLAQILNQVKEQAAAHGGLKPPPLGPEAVAAVQAFRLIRAALDYPARDRAQIPSAGSAGVASASAVPVTQGV